MKRFSWREWMVGGALLCGACTSAEPRVVASNCDKADQCVKQQALHLDAVDILLVIDDSASIAPAAAELKAQLPRLLTAVTTGSDADTTFPPVNSVHVAVTTTDMNIGNDWFPTCSAAEVRDGVFVRPGEVGLTCEVNYPGYLSFEGGAAPVATVDSVACVPLVFADGAVSGCGFEQPLEAALKALWPNTDTRVSFTVGQGHGTTDNAGFLRDNSLLVVVVVTDEDDCSAQNTMLFLPAEHSPTDLGDVNLRCFNHKDDLFSVQRYVTNLRALRPNNDNVIFAVVGGVPTDLVSNDFRSHYDMTKPDQVDAYYNDVLAEDRMTEIPVDEGEGVGHLQPTCTTSTPAPADSLAPPVPHLAMPSRRLIQVAQGFGANGVIASICDDEFGSATGSIIRAIGQKLVSAGQ